MPYTQVDWTELVPISAANLDQMDQGIKDLADLRPTRARDTSSGTRGSATYGETLAGASGTGPAATITVPASGIVVVHFAARGTVTANSAFCSIAVSGGNTVAASDTWAIEIDTAADQNRVAGFAYFSGLAAASTTFTMQYRNGAGTDTATWSYRELLVCPQP